MAPAVCPDLAQVPACHAVQDMKIERVEDMLDDIREQGDQLTQIQDAMKQPLGYAPDVDESELEAELEVRPPSLHPATANWLARLPCPAQLAVPSGHPWVPAATA